MVKKLFRGVSRVKSVCGRAVFLMLHFKSPKVFCIGKNKTGTTSMAKFFKEIGLIVGPQKSAEMLIKDWGNGEYRRIIRYVKYNGEVFQDIPFRFTEYF